MSVVNRVRVSESQQHTPTPCTCTHTSDVGTIVLSTLNSHICLGNDDEVKL